TERGNSFLKRRSKAAHAATELALNQFDLQPLRNRRYRDLSEGQKQRVLLARAIASRPQLAFFDEPTSAMDLLAEQNAYRCLDALRRHGTSAVVLVTHDLTLARKCANRVLFIDDVASTAQVGSSQEVFSTRRFRERYGMVTAEVD